MQVTQEHYDFLSYVTKERWGSYYYQIHEVLKKNPKSILIIGKGDNIVPGILKKLYKDSENVVAMPVTIANMGTMGERRVKTFDYDAVLAPDIVGDIREIDKVVNEKYDCILCCQVLEHLEWRFFEETIQKLSSICNDTLILSLPQRCMNFRFTIDLPKIHYKFQWSIKRFWEGPFLFNGEHYWEAETVDCSKKTIRKIIRQYFMIENEYVAFENAYHWFLILKNKI